jgi:hypothetical protein
VVAAPSVSLEANTPSPSRPPGLKNSPPNGAAESIIDAALALARLRGGVADFDADWLAATMLPHLDRFQPLIVAGRAQINPILG